VCLAALAIWSLAVQSSYAQSSTVPAPWSARDIGSPTPAGNSSYDPSGTFSIDAGGADIWGTSDKFHFVYQQVSGDVDVVARVDSITQADQWSKSGVMIRASLAANSAHAFSLVSAGKGVAFQRRTQNGGQSTNTAGSSAKAPQWVRLVRAGTRVTAYVSANGTSWTSLGSDTIALGTSAYVGIATTSHNSSSTTSADVSQISIRGATAGLPSGQAHADIGSPAIKGSASFAQGTYTISGAGSDIWDTADQFHYVYQQVTGDVDVSARVASLMNTDACAKAGVMIRASLSAGSTHASMFISPGQGYAFQRRPTTSADSENTDGGAGVAPGWVRVKRTGSLFTAYKSTNGTTWTVVGSDSITMASAVYVGIAVNSHNAAAATRATVTNLSVTAGTSNQPPSVTLTAPANGTSYTAPATIALKASASDPEGQLTKVEFYAGTTLLGTDTTSAYSINWSSVAAGSYSLKAVAYDAAGAKTTSNSVAITVGAVSAPLRYALFHASADHATLVTSYRLNVYASGANPATATPIATANLGKPTPDANGDIKVDELSFFTGLAAGNYVATVSAIGTAGSSQSAAITFTR
jgi:regulation of enolase protein 1 (concanavalin A-like superfamily)